MSAEAVITTSDEKPAGVWVGPLFWWELRRESRRGNYYLPRALYAAGLLLVLYLVMGRHEITQKTIAYQCNTAVVHYIQLQYLAVFLLTPVYVAGAIVEDRQQRTLSLLLTTYLTPTEIILGKLLGRLVPMVGVLVAGLPVLAILQLLGGVNIGWIASHTGLSLLLLLMMGMIAIRASTMCKSVGGAIFMSYLMMAGACFLVIPFTTILGMTVRTSEGMMLLIFVIIIGLLLFAVWALHAAVQFIGQRDRDQDMTMSDMERMELPGSFQDPRVKPPVPAVATATIVPVTELPRPIDQFRQNRRVGSFPILWKETYIQNNGLLVVLGILLFIIANFYLLASIGILETKSYEFHNALADWSQFLSGLLLLMTTVHAAGTVVNERRRQTLLSLLTAPLSLRRVILEFAVGSLWRYRWFALGTFLLVMAASRLQPSSLLRVIPAYLAQLAFFTLLGVAASLVFSTAFLSKMILCLTFFVSFLLLPMVSLSPSNSYVWMLEMILVPHRYWPQRLHDADYRLWIKPLLHPEEPMWVMMVNLLVTVCLAGLLFLFCRRRLHQSLERL